MTGRYEHPGDDRLAPVQLHDGIVVPGALCAELAADLVLLGDYLRGAPPLAAAAAPRLSRATLAVLKASREAAVVYRRQETRRTSAAPTALFLPPAQLPAPCDQEAEMVTTAAAAEAAGVSQEWIRRLAAEGKIRGRRSDRNTWHVHLGDVRSYRDGRRRGTHEHHQDEAAGGHHGEAHRGAA